MADWNASKLAFAKAGGTAYSDDILPAGISHDMLSHAHDQPNVEKLLEWMKEKAIFIAEYSGSRDGGEHVAHADASAEPPPPPPDVPAWSRHRRH